MGWDDLSVLVGRYGLSMSVMYFGADPCSALYVNGRIVWCRVFAS